MGLWGCRAIRTRQDLAAFRNGHSVSLDVRINIKVETQSHRCVEWRRTWTCIARQLWPVRTPRRAGLVTLRYATASGHGSYASALIGASALRWESQVLLRRSMSSTFLLDQSLTLVLAILYDMHTSGTSLQWQTNGISLFQDMLFVLLSL